MNWLYALAAISLLYMDTGANDPYQTPRLLALAILSIPLLLRRSDRKSQMEVPLLVGLGAWALSAMGTRDAGATLIGPFVAPFDCFTSIIVLAGLFFGVAGLGRSPEEAAEAVAVCSIPMSLYAIYQRFYHDSLLVEQLSDGRVVSTQGSPVYLGAALAMAVACAVVILFKRPKLALAAIGLAVPAMMYSGTRGALLASAVAIFFAMPKRYRMFSASALIAAIVLHPRRGAVWSDVGRLEDWRMAIMMFLKHPLLGAGPGTFPMTVREFITPGYVIAQHSGMVAPVHAHNQLLQVLSTTGLVGLVGYLALISGIWSVYRSSTAAVKSLLLPVVAAYAAVVMFNPVSHAPTVVLIMVVASASWTVEANRWRVRGSHFAVALGCLVSVVVCTRVYVGDVLYVQAVRYNNKDAAMLSSMLKKTARLNPWEVRYCAMSVDARVMWATKLPRAQKEQVLREELEDAEATVVRHPNDSFAHESYGRTILVAVHEGVSKNPAEALAAFEYAQGLAPTFPPLMKRRLALARAMGVHDIARTAEIELHKSQALERGG